jgi:NADH-quinone oxidoreductase subunit L
MLGPLAILAAGAIFAGMVLYEPFVAGESAHGNTHAVSAAEADVFAPVAEEHVEVIVEHEVEAPVVEDEGSGFAWNKDAFWGKALKALPENDTLVAAHHVPEWVKLLPLFAGALGIFLAYVAYMFRPGIPAIMSRVFRPLHRLFFNKWFFDELYDLLFVRTAVALGRGFWRIGDQGIIDRFGPDGSASVSRRIAGALSRFQSGFVYQYAFVMMIAVIAMVSWFFFRSGQGL